ncbi:MAG: hypothetical protein WAN36_02410 [Calditrichia bacterium]
MKRREFIRIAGVTGAGVVLVPGSIFKQKLKAAPAAPFLSDPAIQPKFVNFAPNALHPEFKYNPVSGKKFYRVGASMRADHYTGLVNNAGIALATPIWGYGQNGEATWPGKTFEVFKEQPVQVRWENNLFGETHLLPVDTHLHWAFSLPG